MSSKDKEKEPAKKKVPKVAKSLPTSKEPSEDKRATQGQMLILATLPFTTKKNPKDKGVTQATVPEPTIQAGAKANPPLPKTT